MPKLIQERWKCLGCGACVSIAPEFWEMADDGKSVMKIEHKVLKTEEGELHEAEIKEDDVEKNKEAADACPVRCIKIE